MRIIEKRGGGEKERRRGEEKGRWRKRGADRRRGGVKERRIKGEKRGKKGGKEGSYKPPINHNIVTDSPTICSAYLKPVGVISTF